MNSQTKSNEQETAAPSERGRVIGLDVGAKRIGVAISDGLGITAQPLTVVNRKNPETDIEKICKIVCKHKVSLVVCGLPLRLDGEHGKQADAVKAFVDALTPRAGVPVVQWDERLSTVSAERAMLEGSVRRRKRRRVIDRVAAQIILQHYLDSNQDCHRTVSG